MRTAILQSNYIPWVGYFDIIGRVDLFIFHDDLQYTKGDWRNRNKIKTPKGTEWLTIPCGTDENRLICEVKLEQSDWQKKHWEKIKQYYSKAPHFREYKGFFESVYIGKIWNSLSDMNQHVIRSVSREIFGFETEFADSRTYQLATKKGERVMELLKKCGATTYLSGPAAKDYLKEDDFVQAGIRLEWMEYGPYGTYEQFFPPFEIGITVLDAVFHLGKGVRSFIRPGMGHTEKPIV